MKLGAFASLAIVLFASACKTGSSGSETKDLYGQTDYRNSGRQRAEPEQPGDAAPATGGQWRVVYTTNGFAGPLATVSRTTDGSNWQVVASLSTCNNIVECFNDTITFTMPRQRRTATLSQNGVNTELGCVPSDNGATCISQGNSPTPSDPQILPMPSGNGGGGNGLVGKRCTPEDETIISSLEFSARTVKWIDSFGPKTLQYTRNGDVLTLTMLGGGTELLKVMPSGRKLNYNNRNTVFRTPYLCN